MKKPKAFHFTVLDKGAQKLGSIIVNPLVKVISKKLAMYMQRQLNDKNKEGELADLNYESSDEEEINESYDSEFIERIKEGDSEEEELY
jgi:hypothetical protein